MRPAEAYFRGVEGYEQFHQVGTDGRTRGLNEEHIAATHVFTDLYLYIFIAKVDELDAPRLNGQRLVNALGQCGIAPPGKDLEIRTRHLLGPLEQG